MDLCPIVIVVVSFVVMHMLVDAWSQDVRTTATEGDIIKALCPVVNEIKKEDRWGEKKTIFLKRNKQYDQYAIGF